MTTMPKWATPERQKVLVDLWEPLSNKCLQGHPVCPVVEHYEQVKRKVGQVFTIVDGKCKVESSPESDKLWDAVHDREYRVYFPKQPLKLNVEIIETVEHNGLYEATTEEIIEVWKAEDRERENYLWKLEQQQIHDGAYGKFGDRFDPVARDNFMVKRPEFYLVGLGVSAVTFHRVALVRIPSSSVHLFVDVSRLSSVQRINKHKRRKIRQGKAALPDSVQAQIHQICLKAVRHWWDTPKA